MEAETPIDLELGERRVPLRVQRIVETTSRHTGRPLVEVHAVASTSDGAEHAWLTERLREVGEQRIRSVEPFEGVRRWRVSWNSYAESDGEHRYMLILNEDEELTLEELVLDGGVRLRPYAYREVFTGDDELTIWAKLTGTRQEVLRLRALRRSHASFPVVRRGISPVPRRMRFGVAEWSEHEEGQIKYRMVLVDADADPAEHPELVRIEEENIRASLGFYMNFVDQLAQRLESRGLLSAGEVEAARSAAREAPWPARHEFWRVPDVDRL
jgi:hypothetical protein